LGVVNKALMDEIASLGGDPTDATWHWFVKRGPHGSSFTWGQTKGEPLGYVGVEHLQQIVDEQTRQNASFPERARSVVNSALNSKSPEMLRRAIQVAAVVGADTELKVVARLTGHEDNSVAADARASVFHLTRRLKALQR
jgi:hypothetical protein